MTVKAIAEYKFKMKEKETIPKHFITVAAEGREGWINRKIHACI